MAAIDFDLYANLGVALDVCERIPEILNHLKEARDSAALKDFCILGVGRGSKDLEPILKNLDAIGHGWAKAYVVLPSSKAESEAEEKFLGRMFRAFQITAFIDIRKDVVELGKYCKHGTLCVNPETYNKYVFQDFISPNGYNVTKQHVDAFVPIGD